MSTFSEYAALARQLADQRRETDQDAAAEAGRRRAMHATLDQLTRRLAVQSHRLGQLGHAIGLPADPPPAAGGDRSGTTTPGSSTPGATSSGGTSGAGAVPDGGAAAAPGRPGVGAYPPGAPGGAVVALPAAAGVPAPRAGVADPAAELAEVRRLADETDRLVQVTEAVARQPPLLPTWSPLARALAVYTGCAAAGVVLMLIMVVAADLAVVGLGALYAATCAGLPVLSFVAGYLVLGRWGRPALGSDQPPRFVPLGFVTCVLLVPLAYCGYLLLFRLVR
ncbi:hypothetical protein OOK41_12225 [Micromonospora sp. NBC_01655]|uniref:hypothetical protein n=1 Tax=Micromonospora sp. NBC_01655 TaxID=2975983 RepID=UPI002252325A|nr:hypothetical protein [Micromonospora sp. NBC_01655]MCX4471068.1 hypothetical protein [Micromonospora sp. NBC_01655]